ncbi:phosphotyrosine protein phosphatases I [Xylariaceae sp. FL0804]|nr:phosphotyrosine protein phosphatases I [Xylariaceae sp. FL0804]
MAEGVFRSLATDESSPYRGRIGTVDSCGTGGYHTGDEPDSRTMSTLEDNGITTYTHEARRLQDDDFEKFDYIFAMDQSNYSDLQKWRRDGSTGRARVMMFGEFSGKGRTEAIRDPYYGGRDGFEKAFEQCSRFSKNFLATEFPDVTPK